MQEAMRENEAMMGGDYKERLKQEHTKRLELSGEQSSFRQQLLDEEKYKQKLNYLNRMKQQSQYKEALDNQFQQ